MLYMGTLEVIKVSYYHHFPGGIMFMVELFIYSNHSNTIGVFGGFIVVGV